MISDPRTLLVSLFQEAVAAADPKRRMADLLPDPPPGRTVVVGAGKAAASMARAFEDLWPGPLSGLVVTRYGHAEPTSRVEIVEAAHPVPDAAGEAATRRMLSLLGDLSSDDLVVALVSGGGSALLAAPLEGLTLADEQAVARALLASGAPIGEMNCVRRHTSAVKGGRLALACAPARLATILISDVPGDDPRDIASGPTVPDATTCADALAIVDRYRMVVPAGVRDALEASRGESVKPGDPRLPAHDVRMLATPQHSLEAASRLAAEHGVPAHILGDAIEGEAREVGRALAGIALQVARYGQPFAPPCVILSGGETTVTLSGEPRGRGGRNVEFLLALGQALDGHPAVHALAADTDGVDGLEEIAGAYLAPDTIGRARAAGLAFATSLADHDGHGFFATLGDAVITGPTRTNVNDFRAILVLGE